MNTPTNTGTPTVRSLALAFALALATAFVVASPVARAAEEPSPTPVAEPSAGPALAPADALCQSADDLRLIVGFLRETDPSEDGWVPVIVGAIAGLSEARQLLDLAGETYRPLVDDLVVSLQDLRSTARELTEEETAGAKIAAVGEAITDVGNAMDALSVRLRTPCPTDG